MEKGNRARLQPIPNGCSDVIRQPELFATFDCCAQEHRLILLGRLLLVIEWQCILWECRWYVLSKLVVDLFSHTTEAHFEHQIRLVFCVIRQYPSLLHPQEASQRPEHCSIGRVYSLAYVRSRAAEVTAPTAQSRTPAYRRDEGVQLTPIPPGQARPRSQKSRQENGSTPTPCLDKAVHARDTHKRKARAGLKPYTKHCTMHKQLFKYSA